MCWAAAALIMVGGWYSFKGINGAARYHKTPVEAVPVTTMQPYDDRIEMPRRASSLSQRLRPRRIRSWRG